MVPDWSQTGPRLAPDWPQTGPQTGSKLGPNCSQIVSRLCLNCAQTVPRHAVARAIARVTGRAYRLTGLTRHSLACCQTSPDSPDTPPAWFQISRDSQTLTCMLRSPCQTHLTLSCVLPDSPGITDTLLQVSKLYRLNCASRSMLLQVFLGGPKVL